MELIEVAILVISFVILLGLGVPVAYSIGLSSMITLMISIPALPALSTLAQRMATSLDSFTLLAIPFFILTGQFMKKGGIALRLVDFAKVLVGRLPGGLAFVNIISCMLFGAISGSAVAAASAIGSFMSGPMEKEGYSRPFAAAINITSSTTGLIIPPSNVLIIYSLASGGVSIAALFLAGYVPGLLVGFALMSIGGIWSYIKKYPLGEKVRFRFLVQKTIRAIPSLLLLVIVMGGIVMGVFTATEASAVAVVYAAILSMMVYKEVTWKDVPEIFIDTAKTTAIVMLLISTSMGMSWVISYENIPQGVGEILMGLSDNKIAVLIIINLLLLVVGTFMDMTPAILIFTPIFLPVVTELGIDPVHFGIIMVLNLCIGLCTPPVGSVLFVGVGVFKTTIQEVIKPLLPLFIAMLATLILVTYVADLSLWLPRLFGF